MKAALGFLVVVCLLSLLVLFAGVGIGFGLHAIVSSIELSAAVLAGVVSFGVAVLSIIQCMDLLRAFEASPDDVEDDVLTEGSEFDFIVRPRRRAREHRRQSDRTGEKP